MNAYSVDLRSRIVHCVDSGQAINDVAERFEVSERTVRRYLKQRRETGDLAPKKPPGPRFMLSQEQVEVLRENLHEQRGLTLAERCEWLHEREGVRLSVTTMHRWVKRLKYSRKKARSAPSSETRATAGRSRSS